MNTKALLKSANIKSSPTVYLKNIFCCNLSDKGRELTGNYRFELVCIYTRDTLQYVAENA